MVDINVKICLFMIFCVYCLCKYVKFRIWGSKYFIELVVFIFCVCFYFIKNKSMMNIGVWFGVRYIGVKVNYFW